MTRRSSPRELGSNGPTPADAVQEDRLEEPEWRAWIRDLGRRQRQVRKFLGLSQEQVAGLGGVSQGAVSRFETARGLATPMLVVVKINAALACELRRLDPTLLNDDLRETLELQRTLIPSSGGLGFKNLPLAEDAQLEELIRLYRETPDRHRGGVLSVVRAMVLGLRKGAPLALVAFVA